MTRRAAPVMVAVGVVVAVLAVLLVAGPAAADDETTIDSRLSDAGYREAYTLYTNVDGGVRVSVDYVTSSADRAAYDAEAEGIARLIWDNLELRVLVVDVAPSSTVSWLDGGLPPTVSLTRGDLEQRFGPRSPALDVNDSSWLGSEEAGLAFVGVGALVVLLLGGGVGFLVGWLVGRRRKPDPVWGGPPSDAWAGPGGWGAQPAWPGGGSPQPAETGGWGAQPAGPVGPWSGGQPAAPSAPPAAPSPHDPWRPA